MNGPSLRWLWMAGQSSDAVITRPPESRAEPPPARSTARRPAARSRLTTRGTQLLFAPLALGLLTLVVFWEDLVGGLAYYGSDTSAFYYPLTTWWAAQLKSGHLPLWLPYIFGGYPLFADGEIGMLYPPNLLAFGLLSSDTAFAWLRPLHFWLAGLFTYWLARLLGLERFGALLAGLTFSFGSFLVAHLQHENLIRSTIWLPLTLGLFELALRSAGRRRLRWLLASGLTLAVQMLGVHVQPVLLSLLALAAWALVGPFTPPSPARQPFLGSSSSSILHLSSFIVHPLSAVRRLSALAAVTAIALGLAAVQLLPLYQLGERSMRAGGVSYEFSTSYSVPPAQLITLLLPYLFRPDPGAYFGLWGADETTLYMGIAPLLLLVVALAYLRTRLVAFCGLLGGLSLLLTLGDYLPVRLYGLVWSLPGFSFMRVPARFSLLFLLAAALLAGLGADWLAGRAFDRPPHQARPRVRRLVLLASASVLGALILAALFVLARVWLEQDPAGTRRAIESTYLTLRRGDWRLSASAVYFGLLRSLDPGNPRTLAALLLLVCASVLLLLRSLHRAPARLWQVAVLVLVAVDLAFFARGFYPHKPVEALKLFRPAVQYLAEHNGLHRVFVEPGLYSQLGPNQLVPWGIDFAGGYSSLEPRRVTEYFWSIVRQDNVLLDLYNVRYVVAPRNLGERQNFEGTLYHPADRLMHGVVGNPSGTETFEFQPWWTEALSVVATGERLRDVPYGQPVAEIVLRGPGGERRLVLRSGVDVDDESAPGLGPPLPGGGFGPRLVWSGPAFQNPFQLSALYGSTLPLEEPLLATSLTIHRVGPNVPIDVYGLGLHDRPGLPIRSLTAADRARYRLVYQDQDVSLFENRAALPRAFLVPSARVAAGSRSPVEQLTLGTFDPSRQLLLDGTSGQVLGPGTPDDQVGTAEVVEYGAERVVVQVDAQSAGYLVLGDRHDDDWRARIDGRDAPVLRANAIFRAVPVEPGPHQVVFSYEPRAVPIGATISLATLTIVGLLAFWTRRS